MGGHSQGVQMKRTVLGVCLVVLLAISGAVVWGLTRAAASDKTASASPDISPAEAAKPATAGASAGPEPAAADPEAVGAGSVPVTQFPIPTISIPPGLSAEKAEKVIALNQAIIEVTQEATRRPPGDRMTAEEINELIRTRIKGIIPSS
jgi:hypothetical protein